MNGAWKALTLIAVALAATACGQPATDAPEAESAAPAAETGPDPTVVDAGHYKVEFENDQVRVVRITYGKGESSVMHYHPESVAVFLTPHHVAFTTPDGTREESQLGVGQHVWSPAGQHNPENLADGPLELVQVELKPGAGSTAAGTGPDPTESDPGHYTAEFENDRVRVLRIRYGPGEAAPESHRHPDSVAVFLTDQKAALEQPDGSVEEMDSKAGEHRFVPGGDHLPKNLADEPFELILVELK